MVRQSGRNAVHSYRAHGFGKWIILDAHSHDPIGDSGLMVLAEYGWIDLGFRLAHHYWGKGLAAEVASAWVRAAFLQLNITRLGAFAHIENIGSIRVLEKVGFHAERQDVVMGIQAIVFSLEAKQLTATCSYPIEQVCRGHGSQVRVLPRSPNISLQL